MKRQWGIVAYAAGGKPGREFICSSVGKSYRELMVIAKRLNRNGEGQRYAVRTHFVETNQQTEATE